MEEYFDTLKKCKLFNNISSDFLIKLLGCLDYRIKDYRKNEFIINADEHISSIGIVLDGTLTVIKENFDGNRNIISKINPSELFGESIVFAELDTTPFSITAVTNSKVLYLNPSKLITCCSNTCGFHTQLISNALKILAKKNIELNYKIELLSHKTISERILFYLQNESKRNNTKSFKIPFSRNDLADFLCINRSALSRELSNLKKQGVLDYNKSDFHIL